MVVRDKQDDNSSSVEPVRNSEDSGARPSPCAKDRRLALAYEVWRTGGKPEQGFAFDCLIDAAISRMCASLPPAADPVELEVDRMFREWEVA
jgi:hypothetical protein